MVKDGDLESHQNNLYHKNAVLQAEKFLSRYEELEKEVKDKEYSFIPIEKQQFSSELELWFAKWIRVKNESKYKIYYLFFQYKLSYIQGGYLPTTVIDVLD